MAKRPTGFPPELSFRIKWTGPSPEQSAAARSGAPPHFALGPMPEEAREKIGEANKLANGEVAKEMLSKLRVLSDHYGLAADRVGGVNHFLLCIFLCRDFFSGFEVDYKPNSGRPKKWDEGANQSLVADILSIRRQKSCGDFDACRFYLRRKLGRMPSQSEAKSLNSRLVEARDSKKNFVMHFLDNDRVPNSLSIWKAQLIEQFSTEISKVID